MVPAVLADGVPAGPTGPVGRAEVITGPTGPAEVFVGPIGANGGAGGANGAGTCGRGASRASRELVVPAGLAEGVPRSRRWPGEVRWTTMEPTMEGEGLGGFDGANNGWERRGGIGCLWLDCENDPGSRCAKK